MSAREKTEEERSNSTVKERLDVIEAIDGNNFILAPPPRCSVIIVRTSLIISRTKTNHDKQLSRTNFHLYIDSALIEMKLVVFPNEEEILSCLLRYKSSMIISFPCSVG